MLALSLLLSAGSFDPVPAEETRVVTDDLGRIVEVPAQPRRIISTSDNSISMVLADFGVPFVGSHARVGPDGTPFMRGVGTIYGITLEGNGIVPVSVSHQFDYEAMIALEPDLIFVVDRYVDQLSMFDAIAPTYVVAEVPKPFAIQISIARALGLQERFRQRRAIYEEEVALMRDALSIPAGSTWALLTPLDGAIRVAVGNYNFTQVLDDLGFIPNSATQQLIDDGVVWSASRSVETLPDLDADIVFVHYNATAGWGPQRILDRFEDLLPNWCSFLPACAKGNVIFMPAASINAPTFDALNATLDVIGSHYASRLMK